MDLSIITVTWNSADHIAEQIRSVQRSCLTISYEQIVVDNGSTDGTVDIVRTQFPQVRLILNNKNTGFATANNQGAAVATGDFFLFLNPDMKVAERGLDMMIDWMKTRPNVGIAGPILVTADEAVNREAMPRRFPTLFDQLVLLLKIPHVFPWVLDRYLMRDMDPTREQMVDSVRGACLFMRREIVDKLGWAFDPRYAIWFEDVDICREAKRLGFHVMYTPIMSCVDHVGQSFKKRDPVWKQWQFTRSMLQYFRKWEPLHVWLLLALFRPMGIFLAWVAALIHKSMKT